MVQAVLWAGLGREGSRCSELPGRGDRVVGYDHDCSPGQQGKECEEHDLVRIEEVLKEAAAIGTRSMAVHHEGHGDRDGEGLVGGRAGESQDCGQRPLAAGCRV